MKIRLFYLANGVEKTSLATMSSVPFNPVITDYNPSVRDYIALLKPRVMSLVVFAGVAGIVVAPGTLHPLLALVAVLCIAVSAGGAAAINMWYDRDIDAIMARTKGRPLPQGRMAPASALEFGIVLSVGASLLMALALGWQAAFWLSFANLFYVFVYTMFLKRRTPHNIVIGGAAGAFPPVIGWAAAIGDQGSLFPLAPWLLFTLIFLWTPPHFWALALYRAGDYGRAGVPMMPNVAGARSTKIQMLIYTLLCAPFAVSPYFMGLAGVVYLIVSGVLSAMFIISAVRVLNSDHDRPAMQMFAFSILYLFALLATLMGDHLL